MMNSRFVISGLQLGFHTYPIFLQLLGNHPFKEIKSYQCATKYHLPVQMIQRGSMQFQRMPKSENGMYTTANFSHND